MAGRPYEAGGIRVTADATRAAARRRARALARERRAEALRAGITHVEIKSGYGLDVAAESALCEVAAELTDDVTFLGAHVVPGRVRGRADDYVDSSAARCSTPARRGAAGSTPSARRRVRRRAVARRARGRAAPPGSGADARQPTRPGPGVRLAVELGAASVDHCTYLDRRRRRRPRRQRHRRHVPPGDRLLDPPAVSRRLPVHRRRRDRRDRDQLQPWLELHDLDGLLHRARRPRHGHHARRGAGGRTLGGAGALRRDDIGRLAPGARADASSSTRRATSTSPTARACRSSPPPWSADDEDLRRPRAPARSSSSRPASRRRRARAGVLCADHHLGYSRADRRRRRLREPREPVGRRLRHRLRQQGGPHRRSRGRRPPQHRADHGRRLRRISFGVGRKNGRAGRPRPSRRDPAGQFAPQRSLARARRASSSAPIGRGNHYVDLFADEADRVWVGVHFGSRGFGHKPATRLPRARRREGRARHRTRRRS